MPHVVVEGIRKTYGDVLAVDDMSFTLEAGNLLSLLGPSGCGKTTTLDTIGGLTTPDTGTVIIDGEDVTDTLPENRDTVKVFQEYALFPHMTVGKNVGFGLEMENVRKDERTRRVEDVLEMVELGGLEDRKVDELSGGQRQRVATARALVKEPSVLLLDEPFSALDLKLREQLQIELKKLQEELGITTIHVTHDQEEAMVLSDKIIVMSEGRKLQEGSPVDVYENPRNEFVADFVGKSNMIRGTIVGEHGDGYLAESKQTGAQFRGVSTDANGALSAGDDVKICIRPEKCELLTSTDDPGENNTLPAILDHKFLLGSLVQYRLSVEETGLQHDSSAEFIVEDRNRDSYQTINKNDSVSIYCSPEHVKILAEDAT